MQTPSEFLKSQGEGLARYERARVARVGCAMGLVGLVAAIALAVMGVVDLHPIFPHFLRVIMAFVFGTIIVIFVGFAAAETISERKASRQIATYLASGEADLSTLLDMARTRAGRFPGSESVIALLEKITARSSSHRTS